MCSEQRQDLSPPGCRISLKPFWWPTSCGSHGGCSCTWGFLGLWVAPLSSANPAPPRSCRDFPPNLTPPNSAGFLLFPLSFPPQYPMFLERGAVYIAFISDSWGPHWLHSAWMSSRSGLDRRNAPTQSPWQLLVMRDAPGTTQGHRGLLAVALPGGWDAVWLQHTAHCTCDTSSWFCRR